MTSTSIITTPHLLSPVNDIYGNYFQLNNATSNATNFKYLVKLYVNSSFVVKEILPPRPTTGYGVYSPYKNILSTLRYYLNNSITGATYCPLAISNYYIQYGLEYNPSLTFSNTLLAVVDGGVTRFGLSFSTNHGFTASDVITIQTENPYLYGTVSVRRVLDGITGFVKAIETDRVFTASSNVSVGYINDLQRWNGTSSTYYGYNGTRQYGERNVIHYDTEVVCLGAPITAMTASSTGTGWVTGDTFSVVGVGNTASAVGTVTAAFGSVTSVALNSGGNGYFIGNYGTNARTGFGLGLTVSVTNVGYIEPKPFLTEFNVSNTKSILPNQNETLSVILNANAFPNGIFSTTYNYYNSSGTLIGMTAFNKPISSSPVLQRWDIPVGTSFLDSIGATTSIDNYDVHITAPYIREVGPISFYYIGSTVSVPSYSAGQQLIINGGNNDAIYTVAFAPGGVPTGGSITNAGTGYVPGTYNTTALSGTGSGFVLSVSNIIPSGVGYTYSETRRFKIDRTCSNYTNTRLMFMNKFGAFEYFNFRFNNIKTYNITRNEYKQNLAIDYSIGDRQRTIMSNVVTETHTVYSDFVTEDEYAAMQAAYTGIEAYIIDEMTGDAYPIIITDATFTPKTLLNERIFTLQMTYTTSYDINRQSQ